MVEETRKHCLTGNGDKAAEVMRSLVNRSIVKHNEVYLLHRVAGALESPKRDYAIGQIRKVMKIRELPVPKMGLPLSTPMSVHPSYKSALHRLAWELVVASECCLPPYHYPRARLVEKRWPRIGHLLYNHKSSMRKFSIGSKLVCNCDKLRGVVP